MSILQENSRLAEEVIHYSRLCYERHFIGAAGGNLGARVPNRDAFIVTASGVSLRDVSPQNLMVIDSAGKTLEGPPGARPSKETGFHLSVYRVRPQVQAIIHVHPTHATVFSMRRQPIPTVTISAQLKLKQGAVVPDAAPGSKELCDLVTQAVKEAPADATVLLMQAHGLIAMRPTLCDAFDDAELAEDTAKIALFSQLAASAGGFSSSNARLIDLTAPLNERIQCYPTDPPFTKQWHVDFVEHGVYVSRLEMGAHAGTHVDAPMHFLGEGASDVGQIALDRFLGQAVCVDAPKKPGEDLTCVDLGNTEIRAGDIVLFRTGWESCANSPAFFADPWPGFHPSLVEELIRRGAKAIGGDIASADSPAAIAAGAPAHKLAARAGMPIFEALVNLDQVAGQRFTFLGFPLKLEKCEASPIRAIAMLDRTPLP